MSQYFSNEYFQLSIAILVFVALLVVVYFIYRFAFSKAKHIVLKTESELDDFILDLFKIPSLWLIYWILLKIFMHVFLTEFRYFPYLLHINSLLIIWAITWFILRAIKAGAHYIQSKLDINSPNNLNARKNLTQIKVFKGIANTAIIIIALSISLLTFEQARTFGLSLLTSAGIIGVIVGFAAQKSIGMLLAGIQLAITQPIRLDDVVIVENEWGRIEEITLTYVVVKIWDERRLVLPVNYFLENPFQNWTRNNADITGTIFLNVDYAFPVNVIREILPQLLKDTPDWDGRLVNVQVTKMSENSKEIRILLSSSDASKNWDLRANIREKLIDFINCNYPDTFSKIRIKTSE